MRSLCRAITIQQPYANLIADQKKWIENRTWRTKYTGLIAIHAGSGTKYMTRNQVNKGGLITGAVIAYAWLYGCINLTNPGEQAEGMLVAAGKTMDDFLNHAHTEGPECWVLGNVNKLDKPIPMPGKLGLWKTGDLTLS